MSGAGRVVVLGGGIIGVTTAYYLAQSGRRVTLVERQPEAGLETSFANGGLITPSMAEPWASPGIPRLMLKWLGREDSPFLIRPSALPGLATWGLRFLGQCNAAAWRRNTEIILRLCRYSLDCLRELVAETGIDYDANRRGTLYLFRDQLSMDSSLHVAETVGAMGVSYRVLDRGACLDLEPALKPQAEKVSGGIHFPDDEAGDAHKFTQRLAAIAAVSGIEARYGETVQAIEVERGAVAAVVTDKGRIAADACVVALASGSPAILRPLGLRPAIYPVKGYSVTYPAEGWNGAPVVPFVDYARKVGIVRLGDRIRLAGTAEFAGDDKSLNPRRIANITRVFFELFPDYPQRGRGVEWAGLRPMTPDGIPYLGPTRVPGLYLNSGHGPLGWTMACGSARAVADLVLGRKPDIDVSGMTAAGR